MSKSESPFFGVMFTLDTHPIRESVEKKGEFGSVYENMIYDTNKKTIEFIKWVESQFF